MHIVSELMFHLSFIFGRFGYTSCRFTKHFFSPRFYRQSCRSRFQCRIHFLCFPHVPNHLSYVCLAFCCSWLFAVWISPLSYHATGGDSADGRIGRTNERTNEQRHPRRVISIPLGWPGLGWIEHHLYAYYILLTTYYLIIWRSESNKGREAVGDTQPQFRGVRDGVYDAGDVGQMR